jgi:hypothetical protein
MSRQRPRCIGGVLRLSGRALEALERTTNPIESTFATVRHRTIRTKGCISNKTALAMVFKLVEAAQRAWRRLDGSNQLPKVTPGCEIR